MAKLTIVYPARGAVIKNGLPGIFIYGAVSPAGGKLLVNGVKTAVYRTGAWLAYIPAHTGDFDINLSYSARGKTYTCKSSIFIEKPSHTPAKKAVAREAAYHKPDFNFTRKQPLNGLKVFVDPGHSPKPTYAGEGKTSPRGIYEHTINYKTALAARRALAALGAKVKLSKPFKEQVLLTQRVERAKAWGAHIFISLHNNSWPDNVNPLKRKNGFGMYYCYPHAKPLARALEKSYIRHVKQLPSEGIMERDFFVLRENPQIPAVLIESAYITLPEHEELLLKPAFIKKLADAIAEGVQIFVNPKGQNLLK